MVKSKMGWWQRYRPESLEEMALAPELRERFERYLSGDALPHHLILYGPPGFGKTTITEIMAHQLYRDKDRGVMSVKAAETGNVEYIRTTVLDYMRGAFGTPHLLIFEEATGLSREAMETLRVPMEQWFEECHIIFLTNDVSKLDDAVKSRCEVIPMTRPPVQECARVLGNVLKAEAVDADPQTIFEFTSAYFGGGGEDMRGFLSEAQHQIETQGMLPVPPEADRAAGHMLEVWQGNYRAEDVPDGAKLLNQLADQFAKYVSLPNGGVEALALWTVFAWVHEAFSISPILALVSPTPRAGKSTVFELLKQLLIPKETHLVSSLTGPVLFRIKGLATADEQFPSDVPTPPSLCLLIDEADYLRLSGDLAQILDSGHTRSTARVLRVAGKYSSWYPKALAMINRPSSPLPDAVRDRSIVIPMQRKKKDERLARFPKHQRLPELAALSESVAYWVRDHFAQLRDLGAGELLADDQLNDREKDNWHQLMAIAHAAGGDWADRARHASLILSDSTREFEVVVELLRDIRQVFDVEQVERIRSVVLVEKLRSLDDSPWKELRLTANKLGRMVRAFPNIRVKPLWLGKRNVQGYERAQFEDAWARHL